MNDTQKQTNLTNLTTEDLKATLNFYRLNRRSLKSDAQVAAQILATDIAKELQVRIGPNEYSAVVLGLTPAQEVSRDFFYHPEY